MQDHEPGNIISPSLGVPEEPEQTPIAPPAPAAPQDDSQELAASAPLPTSIPVTPVVQTESSPPANSYDSDQSSVAWQAAEYGTGVRSGTWYALVIFGAALLSAAVYFLNRDVVTAVLVLVALIGLAFATGKKPRQQSYIVDDSGIRVGNKEYYYRDFHSFSIVEDAQATSIVLVPLKRFMPAINVYVPIEYEQQVVAVLSDILPMEHHKPDLVEKLSERLHL